MKAGRAPAKSFRDLIVWQRARQLVRHVYELTRGFPDSERFGISSQIQRAAVSVVANIAEGWGRATRPELRRFSSMARGSLYELEAILDLSEDLGYSSSERLAVVRRASDETGRMLTALRESLRRKAPPKS
jgi:four helix bundle protein